MYTTTLSNEAEQWLRDKTPTPEVGLHNFRAYKTWILSDCWATAWRQWWNCKFESGGNLAEGRPLANTLKKNWEMIMDPDVGI